MCSDRLPYHPQKFCLRSTKRAQSSFCAHATEPGTGIRFCLFSRWQQHARIYHALKGKPQPRKIMYGKMLALSMHTKKRIPQRKLQIDKSLRIVLRPPPSRTPQTVPLYTRPQIRFEQFFLREEIRKHKRSENGSGMLSRDNKLPQEKHWRVKNKTGDHHWLVKQPEVAHTAWRKFEQTFGRDRTILFDEDTDERFQRTFYSGQIFTKQFVLFLRAWLSGNRTDFRLFQCWRIKKPL